MQLRAELEPQFDVAEKLYPEIYAAIMEYTAFYDENGDEGNAAYKQLEAKLKNLTGKDMAEFNLWEWWEAEGAESLAFAISLPTPKQVDNVTLEELTELVKRAQGFNGPSDTDTDFRAAFYDCLVFSVRYFHKLLELNFEAYSHKLFQRNKDAAGNYFEYSTAEIVARLWNTDRIS